MTIYHPTTCDLQAALVAIHTGRIRFVRIFDAHHDAVEFVDTANPGGAAVVPLATPPGTRHDVAVVLWPDDEPLSVITYPTLEAARAEVFRHHENAWLTRVLSHHRSSPQDVPGETAAAS